jgi:hypothetical protein
MAYRKFMQSLDDRVMTALEKEADTRGITLQELVRSIVVPDWIRINKLVVEL